MCWFAGYLHFWVYRQLRKKKYILDRSEGESGDCSLQVAENRVSASLTTTLLPTLKIFLSLNLRAKSLDSKKSIIFYIS